jgi:hypothetical protein
LPSTLHDLEKADPLLKLPYAAEDPAVNERFGSGSVGAKPMVIGKL